MRGVARHRKRPGRCQTACRCRSTGWVGPATAVGSLARNHGGRSAQHCLGQLSSNNARRVGSFNVSPNRPSIQMMTASEPGLKETILLVDDEQSVRTIVLKILRRARYNVLEAENGEAALRIAEEHPGKIDLVITDMYMPGLRGREVVERLAPTRPGLRALFISGYADQDARTGVPGGANFLNKPFSGQELANAVEKVLKGPPL